MRIRGRLPLLLNRKIICREITEAEETERRRVR
jgi:hypothetical protein